MYRTAVAFGCALLVAVGGAGCGPTAADGSVRSDAAASATFPASAGSAASIRLEPCRDRRLGAGALCGSHDVYENRQAGNDRVISLNIVVLPALEQRSGATPVFYLAGGPGAGATRSAPGLSRSWMRRRHDIVLVDQRGTGRSNPLGCAAAAFHGLQGYLDRSFGSPEYFARCRDSLERTADLTMYSTPTAMDDLDEVRRGLGYERINLYGGSYGSRAALVYMRRHPDTVRAAILTGVAPLGFTNPLYHAREAQNALDRILAECEADAACRRAFPGLSTKLAELMDRLDAQPAAATVSDPRSGSTETIRLGREAFADGLRVFMYYMPRSRRVPLLIHEAWRGNVDAVAQEMLNSNVGLASALQMGMLLSVTCAEDVDRIDPASVPAATEGTFLGDARVRRQIAACEVWPRSELPAGFGEPVVAEAPVLLFSGTLDPVTGPRWGEVAASHLPNSLHLVVPGAHGVGGSCVRDISRAFLASGTLGGLDTECVDEIRLPPFELR